MKTQTKEEILEAFLHKNRASHLGYARRRVREEAEDALQTAIIQAFRTVARLDTRPDLDGWFYKILARECRRIWQLQQKRARIEQAIERIEGERYRTARGEAPRIETRVVVRSLIATLPRCERVAMTAVYVDGLSVGEAAERAQCTYGAMQIRLMRGRQRVSHALGDVR